MTTPPPNNNRPLIAFFLTLLLSGLTIIWSVINAYTLVESVPDPGLTGFGLFLGSLALPLLAWVTLAWGLQTPSLKRGIGIGIISALLLSYPTYVLMQGSGSGESCLTLCIPRVWMFIAFFAFLLPITWAAWKPAESPFIGFCGGFLSAGIPFLLHGGILATSWAFFHAVPGLLQQTTPTLPMFYEALIDFHSILAQAMVVFATIPLLTALLSAFRSHWPAAGGADGCAADFQRGLGLPLLLILPGFAITGIFFPLCGTMFLPLLETMSKAAHMYALSPVFPLAYSVGLFFLPALFIDLLMTSLLIFGISSFSAFQAYFVGIFGLGKLLSGLTCFLLAPALGPVLALQAVLGLVLFWLGYYRWKQQNFRVSWVVTPEEFFGSALTMTSFGGMMFFHFLGGVLMYVLGIGSLLIPLIRDCTAERWLRYPAELVAPSFFWPVLQGAHAFQAMSLLLGAGLCLLIFSLLAVLSWWSEKNGRLPTVGVTFSPEDAPEVEPSAPGK